VPLSLARKIARALGNTSETTVRELDEAISGYVRDVPQASSTVVTGAAWNDITGKPATFDPLTVVTEDSTALTVTDEDVVLVDDDTAGAQVTITLPAAAEVNYPVRIKKLGTTANVVIDGDDAETIDGTTTITLSSQYQAVTLVSDGNGWHVFA
jgi:hypothetical protein